MPAPDAEAFRTRPGPPGRAAGAGPDRAISAAERFGQRRAARPGGTSTAVDAVARSAPGSPATGVATQASSWLAASISTLGRPSRSPSAAIRLGEHEQIGPRGRRRAPRPAPARRASRSGRRGRGAGRLRLEPPAQRAAADMDEAPVQIRRQQAPAPRADRRSPSSRTARPTERMHARDRRLAAVARRPRRCRRREAVERRARDRPARRAPVRRQRARCRRAGRVQVTSQRQSASFSRFSQSGVVQMSLACAETLQGRPAHQRRIARDRGRRVQEMRVEMADVGRQLGRQHQRLAEAADAVGRADRVAGRAATGARARR